MSDSTYIEALQQQAESAEAAEKTYRREAAARIAKLEEGRAFAYRRLNLMRAIAAAVSAPTVGASEARAQDEEIAVASGLAVLRSKLGWTSDSETRDATLGRFAPVIVALYNGSLADDGKAMDYHSDVAAALDAFEDWYMDAHRVAFWTLFEVPIPDTPRIDF